MLLILLVLVGVAIFWLVTVGYMCHCTSTSNIHEAQDSAEPGSVAGSDSDTTSRWPNIESETLPASATETPQPPPGNPRTANMDISQGQGQNRRGGRRAFATLLHAGQPTTSPLRPKSASSSSSSSSWGWGSSPAIHNLLDASIRPRSSPRAGSETTDYQTGRSPEEPIPVFDMSL